MKFAKTNALEGWLKEHERKHPLKSRWVNFKVKVKMYIINILNKQNK